MVDLDMTFDPDDPAHEPSGSGDFELIRPGWYECRITDTRRKDTKRGDGWYLQIEMEILGPEFMGRRLWCRLNLKNPSAQAVQIANEQFALLCRATNVGKIRDSSALHGKTVEARVKISPARGQYKESNDVVEFREPRDGTPGGQRYQQDDGGFLDDDPWGEV